MCPGCEAAAHLGDCVATLPVVTQPDKVMWAYQARQVRTW